MNIPRSAIEPFGYTGMPIVTTKSIGWIKCNNELAEAISTKLFEEDARGSFYAPYVPKQVVKVVRDGKWVNFEVGRESLEDTTSGN